VNGPHLAHVWEGDVSGAGQNVVGKPERWRARWARLLAIGTALVRHGWRGYAPYGGRVIFPFWHDARSKSDVVSTMPGRD
jgi:hypothetical protein